MPSVLHCGSWKSGGNKHKMAYGQGWEVSESEAFAAHVAERLGDDEHAMEILEGFIWSAYKWGSGGPQAQQVVGRLWCSRIFTPEPLLVFFEVNEEQQVITLEILTPPP